MAREIDLTKPLSEEDAAYVSQRPWLQAEITLMERNGELEYDLHPAAPAVEEEEEESEDEETYDDLTVAQLKEDLKSRDLSVEGNKATLIARLIEDDESPEEEDDEEEE